jgi:hypothetical protein
MSKSVSEDTLMQRINRKLKHEHEAVRECPATSRSYPTLGDYYLHDTYHNALIAADIDLEALARALGVLGANEQVV